MGSLPPGPKRFSAVDFIRSVYSPVEVMREMAAMYGDTIRFKTHLAVQTLTGDPEVIRIIYTADPDQFDVFGAKVAEPVFGTTSLVVASGERHRRDRKLLSPPFNGSAMRAYGATIAAITAEAAASWAPGRTFAMQEVTQEIALDVIVRVVFGMRGEERIQRTREAVLKLIDSINPVILLFPVFRREFGGVGPWARHRRAVEALAALLIDEIRTRRSVGDTSDDILGLMLRARYDDGSAMSESELTDQLQGLLFAGHETTAVALATTLYWLHREQETLARVMAEIDALGPDPEPDAYASLPYLDAVCMEGLRLNPPVVDVGRMTRRPLEVKGYTIPAGEGVVPSPLLLHDRADLYPEPERFRPSRFLERKFSPFEYIAFGGGSRRCLGAAFAMYEMKVVLGTLLGKYRLRLAGDEPLRIVRRGLTLGPKGGVPMALDCRRRKPTAPGRPASAAA
jgi:cytochrome P450 family 110